MRVRVGLSTLFGLLLLLLAGAPAHARAFSPQVCVAKLATGQSVEAALAGKPAWSCAADQTGLGRGDFVSELRFAPIPAQAGDPMVLRLTSVWQDSAKVRFRYADGSERIDSFTSPAAAESLTVGAIFELPVPMYDAALTSVIIETRGSANLRGVVIGPRLVSAGEAYRIKIALAAIYAAFAGLAIALLVYNFSLWLALRNGFLLDYCKMVLALAAYTFTSSGLLTLLVPAIANNDRLRLNYVLLALTGITALRFTRNFFGSDAFPRASLLAVRVSCWLALVTSLAFAALAPLGINLLDRAYFLAMATLLITGAPLMLFALTRQLPYARLFVAAWIAPLVISVLRAAYGFGLVPYSILLDNSNLIAMSVEALLSSIMVTARLRQLASERDDAVEGEQTARILAATDPLTGLLNRRAFLDQAIGRKARQRLLLIDIDHFKSVNDRLGHEAGDQVLEAVAAAIRHCRPPKSLAVRLGGEEFALLIPRASADQCSVDTLLDAVRETAMPQGIKVTVSIGYSDGQVASEEDWKRLYRLADAALYRAKSDGRNRACRATDFRTAA